ncbi:MAG: GcrA cell cycle regulator [Hyphomonadaceae bacterium]|nr:GcrA cell cycle regulator [Hyphomonadaceae bacterium]MBC6412590.1 GcrA cell cycle regulator [Hyphomonadaceae bacterium]
MAWTEDRVEILTKLWEEGLSASQIAEKLGAVTRNAVIGKVYRLGLSGRAKSAQPKTVPPAKTATLTPRAMREVPPSFETASAPAPSGTKSLPNGEFATILTIRDHMCRWPIGDPSASDFRFCGRRVKNKEPYCEAHCSVAYQPVRRRDTASRALPSRGTTRLVT